jgi:hypothetical protein
VKRRKYVKTKIWQKVLGGKGKRPPGLRGNFVSKQKQPVILL